MLTGSLRRLSNFAEVDGQVASDNNHPQKQRKEFGACRRRNAEAGQDSRTRSEIGDAPREIEER